MQGSFINNRLFRIVTPTLFGLIVYILILLIFDSIKQLSENFFSFEVMFCIFITYIVSELMRLITNTMEKRTIGIERINYRIAVQILVNVIAVFIVTTSILILYYRYLVGYTDFNSELIVFNTIFIFSCLLYNTLYFSTIYLNRTNKVKLNHENLLKQSLENELEDYKSRINPELLYSSLETSIALIRKDKTQASDFIQKLSDVYRYIVSSRRNEPIELQSELEISQKLIAILNAKYQNSITLDIKNKNLKSDKKIIPNTLHIVIEEIIHNNLVSALQTLNLKCSIEDETLVIECNTIKRLSRIKLDHNEFETLKRAYFNFTEKTITMKDDINHTTISIPLLG